MPEDPEDKTPSSNDSTPERDKAKSTTGDLSRKVFAGWEGARFPWWGTLLLPFLILLYFLYKAAREEVNWKAAFAAVAIFELVVFPAEMFSVHRGHWVYNEARIWGPKLLGVPIEEPLLYYIFPVLIVITSFHAIRMQLEGKPHPWRKGGR